MIAPPPDQPPARSIRAAPAIAEGFRAARRRRRPGRRIRSRPAAARSPRRPISCDPAIRCARIADRTGAGIRSHRARQRHCRTLSRSRAGQRLTIPGGRYHLVRARRDRHRHRARLWRRLVADRRRQRADANPICCAPACAIADPRRRAERHCHRGRARRRLPPRHRRHRHRRRAGARRQPAPRARPLASPRRVLPPPRRSPSRRACVGGFSLAGARPRRRRRFGPGASGERNDGIKIAVPRGTPVLAAADGVVAYAGSDIPTLGGLVIIKHGDGWTTVYGHAGQLLVQRGQSVKRGQKIALSGDTGSADRPELPFRNAQGPRSGRSAGQAFGVIVAPLARWKCWKFAATPNCHAGCARDVKPAGSPSPLAASCTKARDSSPLSPLHFTEQRQRGIFHVTLRE